jgi:hypothetical protein
MKIINELCAIISLSTSVLLFTFTDKIDIAMYLLIFSFYITYTNNQEKQI